MKTLFRSVGLLGMLFWAGVTSAADSQSISPASIIPTSNAQVSSASGGWPCWQQAATRYGLNVYILYAIARVETNNKTGLVNKNSNGSLDIGLMQINTWWLPKLEKYGITADALLRDPCLNLNVGAWILAKTIERYGFNWKGVGAYNAMTNWKRARYANLVADELRQIAAEQRQGRASAPVN